MLIFPLEDFCTIRSREWARAKSSNKAWVCSNRWSLLKLAIITHIFLLFNFKCMCVNYLRNCSARTINITFDSNHYNSCSIVEFPELIWWDYFWLKSLDDNFIILFEFEPIPLLVGWFPHIYYVHYVLNALMLLFSAQFYDLQVTSIMTWFDVVCGSCK